MIYSNLQASHAGPGHLDLESILGDRLKEMQKNNNNKELESHEKYIDLVQKIQEMQNPGRSLILKILMHVFSQVINQLINSLTFFQSSNRLITQPIDLFINPISLNATMLPCPLHCMRGYSSETLLRSA